MQYCECVEGNKEVDNYKNKDVADLRVDGEIQTSKEKYRYNSPLKSQEGIKIICTNCYKI